MNPTQHLAHGLLAEGDPHGIVVLRYRIEASSAGPSAENGATDPEGALMRHLELLDRWGFTLIRLSDCRLFLKGELHLPRKPLVLTFDDGSPSLYPVLLNVFREIGGRAVVFVQSGGGTITPTQITTMPESIREGVSAIAETGIEVGSLTCTGRPLTLLTPEVAAYELSTSKTILEDVLYGPVYSCAYPHDAVGPDIKKLSIKAGYDFGVAGREGSTVFGNDLYEIRRRFVSTSTGPLGLALQVFAPHELIRRMRQKSLARTEHPPIAIRIPGES